MLKTVPRATPSTPVFISGKGIVGGFDPFPRALISAAIQGVKSTHPHARTHFFWSNPLSWTAIDSQKNWRRLDKQPRARGCHPRTADFNDSQATSPLSSLWREGGCLELTKKTEGLKSERNEEILSTCPTLQGAVGEGREFFPPTTTTSSSSLPPASPTETIRRPDSLSLLVYMYTLTGHKSELNFAY